MYKTGKTPKIAQNYKSNTQNSTMLKFGLVKHVDNVYNFHVMFENRKL